MFKHARSTNIRKEKAYTCRKNYYVVRKIKSTNIQKEKYTIRDYSVWSGKCFHMQQESLYNEKEVCLCPPDKRKLIHSVNLVPHFPIPYLKTRFFFSKKVTLGTASPEKLSHHGDFSQIASIAFFFFFYFFKQVTMRSQLQKPDASRGFPHISSIAL